jgi:putative ABC transport system permease protein
MPEPTWRRYLSFFGPKAAADLDEELRFHIEARVADYMRRGLSEADARAATATRIGDLATTRGECMTIATRTQSRLTRSQLWDALVQDVRFAFRSLRLQKGWTAVAVLTLALGIGANSAMFSVVNNLLLNPLPYANASRVVVVFQAPSEGNNTGQNVLMMQSGRLIESWLTARSLEAMEPYIAVGAALENAGEAIRSVHTAAVRPTFAAFAGQRPIIGRWFTDEEASSDAPVALVSEGLWRGQYGGDANILGRVLTLNAKPVTVIGVVPAALQLPRTTDAAVDMWLPLNFAASRQVAMLSVARIRPGVSRAAAAQELDALADRVAGAEGKAKYVTQLKAPGEMITYHDSLVFLSLAVALVLVIACTNVAHLLLARASTRQREMAIRAALGAGAGRLFRQLFTESLLLSLAGCVAGVGLGWAGLRLLVAARPQSMSELAAARMDGSTLLATVAVSIVTGVAFALLGAVQAARQSTGETLKGGAVSVSTARSHGRFRSMLVVSEMALCTLLLVTSALLLRSMMHLQSIDPGYDPKGLYNVAVNMPRERYGRFTARAEFTNTLIDRVRAVPGVEGAVITAASSPGSAFLLGALQLEGQADPPEGVTAFIPFNGVEGDYFKVMRMRVLEGTTLTDTTKAAAQVVINEGMARKHWPNGSPLGKRLRVVYRGTGDWKTVVGVVSNAFTSGLTSEASAPMLYLPPGFIQPTLLVRTSNEAATMPLIRALATSMDPHLPPLVVSSVEVGLRRTIAKPRFTMFLLMVFTVVAVGLAAAGLYGVLAYSVAQRTREIGIRVALGASRGVVARTVLSEGLLLAGAGAAVGLVAARWGVKLVGSMLYGVQQTDALSFTLGAIVLVAIAVVACVVPVRRALAVDPLIAIKAD